MKTMIIRSQSILKPHTFSTFVTRNKQVCNIIFVAYQGRMEIGVCAKVVLNLSQTLNLNYSFSDLLRKHFTG